MSDLHGLLAERPLRIAAGGKETSGTVVVIGGPPQCPGAALLCATSALRVGCGRVQVVVDPQVAPSCAAVAWELYVEAWDQRGEPPAAVGALLQDAGVVVVGPGHRHLPADVVQAIAEATEGRLVLDAGALGAAGTLAGRGSPIAAPNPAEAEALVGELGDPAALVGEVVRLTGQPAAVRGERTAVAGDEGLWTFDGAPEGLGTPGSGDVFIGVLAGLLAAGNDPLAALGWATVLHADAGRSAGPTGYLATDIARALPSAVAAHCDREDPPQISR